MSKQRTQCQCGGTFDGTPSGRKRHDRTAQHQDWSATALAQAVAANADAQTIKQFLGDEPTVAPVAAPNEYEANDEQQARYTEQRQLGEAIAASEKAIKKFQAGRRWRETRAPHLVAKWDTLIEEQRAKIALWEAVLEAVTAAIAADQRVRGDAARLFWDGIGAELEALFSTADLPLVIRSYRGTFEFELTTGKVRTGDDGTEYPETRFGYNVTVSAPEMRWSGTPVPAKVNWGTIGSMTVEDAATMHRLHAAAIGAARYLDERIAVA